MPQGVYARKPFTIKHIKNLSKAHIGKKHNYCATIEQREHGRQMGLRNKGKKWGKQSPEHRRKIMKSREGFKHSIESKEKNRLSHMGKKQTSEHIEKARLTRLGKKRVFSLEWRQNIGKARKALGLTGSKSHRFGKSPAHGKGCWFDVPNQGKVWLKSSYEFTYATYLVDKRVDFRYENKRFILDAKTFLPDFYLVKEDRFVEVKGWVKDKDLQKVREMAIFHPDIKIEMITKKEIDKIKKAKWEPLCQKV